MTTSSKTVVDVRAKRELVSVPTVVVVNVQDDSVRVSQRPHTFVQVNGPVSAVAPPPLVVQVGDDPIPGPAPTLTETPDGVEVTSGTTTLLIRHGEDGEDSTEPGPPGPQGGGIPQNIETLTTTGTFTAPVTGRYFVECIGSGGRGGDGGALASGGGGGGGGYAAGLFDLEVGQEVGYQISEVQVFFSSASELFADAGGVGNDSVSGGGGGGGGSNSLLSLTGSAGGSNSAAIASPLTLFAAGGAGGSAARGGGGGIGGRIAATASNGSAGSFPGGGGGGGNSSTVIVNGNGGPGAAGCIYVSY